jgi:SOS response regulatory protein OraA/RecX
MLFRSIASTINIMEVYHRASAKPGRTIASVKVLKRLVRVLLDEGHFDLSHDTYTNHYLYVGKTLDDKEYHELKDASEAFGAEAYARGLLGKGRYTRKQVVERLYARQAKRWMVESIVRQLENEGLIDDRSYMVDRLDYGQARHEDTTISTRTYSKKNQRRLLASYVMDEDLEIEKAPVWLPRLMKQYGGKSSKPANTVSMIGINAMVSIHRLSPGSFHNRGPGRN